MKGLGLCLILLFASELLWAGQNLLPNSSFEEGIAGWRFWRQSPQTSAGDVSEEAARHGRRCFKVINNGTGGANLHSAPIPVGGEQDFTLSVYARTENARGVRIALWALDAQGKTINYGLPHPTNLPADQPAWARFKCIVRTPPHCVALKAHLICNGGIVWWDAVQIERGRDATQYRSGPSASARQSHRNLLSNSDFEDGDLNWNLWHQFPGRSEGGVMERQGRGGSRAFHVRNPGPGGANLHSEPVPCEPNTPYTLSVYARVKEGVGVRISGWGLDKHSNTITYAIGTALPLPPDVKDYTRFSVTFTTPPECAFLKAHLVCNGGQVWWDDCQLERGTAPSKYEPGPRVDMLPRRSGPQAVAYTRAIIREARLREVLAQTERLALYSGKPAPLDVARQTVEQISRTLGAQYLVPDYHAVDYAALDKLMDKAEEILRNIWIALGYAPAGIFQEWHPRLEGPLDKQRLAQEFFIFPCFTRDYFFKGLADWAILKPFGFRLVSGWWESGIRYTSAGEMDTTALDARLATCREQGYTCDICIDGATGAVGALKERLGEAIYLHNAHGDWSPYGNCHNTINIWHPEVRRTAAEYLTKVASRYANNPAVLSYELTNEPSLTIEKHEHGYVYKPIGVGCYSPSAQQAWIAWLKKKYRTIEALNARWRTNYKSFEEAQPPTDLTPPAPCDSATPVFTGPLHDFQIFRAESHAEWFRHCVEAMHAVDPLKPVISQFVSGSMDRKEAAVDLRIMAENVPWDFYGTHDWPGDKPAVDSLYAVSMNRKASLPHWEDEFIWSQWERKGTPEPIMRAALERNLWRQIAWGKRGISLFNLESEWLHDSPNNWNNSLLNIEADLEVPRYSSGIIPTIERKVHLFKDILYRTRIVCTGVAILRPTAATLVAAPDKATRSEGTFIASALLERHEMPLMIPEEHVLSDPSWNERVSLLVLPWAIVLPESVQTALLKWIEDGGALFAIGPPGLFDEYGKPSAILLKRSFGDIQWRYEAAKDAWGTSSAPSPARVGKGIIYVHPERLSVTKEIAPLQKALDTVRPGKYVSTDLPRLEIIPRAADNGEEYLFIINLDAKQSHQGEVSVWGRFTNVVDLSCEARPRVPVKYEKGRTLIPVRLSPGDMVFLSLGTPAR